MNKEAKELLIVMYMLFGGALIFLVATSPYAPAVIRAIALGMGVTVFVVFKIVRYVFRKRGGYGR